MRVLLGLCKFGGSYEVSCMCANCQGLGVLELSILARCRTFGVEVQGTPAPFR